MLNKYIINQAREAFLIWKVNGKPRYGVLFEIMKTTRAHFKLCLRQSRESDSQAKADALAKKLLQTNSKHFWNEVRNLNNAGEHSVALTVGGATGSSNVANMWHAHYKTLLNSSCDVGKRAEVLSHLDQPLDYSFERFTVDDVRVAIKSLKNGKAAGLDMVTSEHVKFSHEKLYVLLALLYNCMIIHGYLPKVFMETIISPVIKDKKGDVTDRNNYRPIAITSVSSKVLEKVILQRFSSYLEIIDHQFGFKGGHSTDMCVFTLKQIIDFYYTQSSPVYMCFLDASKAFDKINHWSLFSKLIKRKLPKVIIRLLLVWYRTQSCIIRWGNVHSKPFSVSNGVRQGGILSPLLFNIYMNELSLQLMSLRTGCNVNGIQMNHLFYADDSVLLAPSPSSLQKLIMVCEQFSRENDIVYNTKKSFVMAVKPKWLSSIVIPTFTLCNNILPQVDSHKYLGVILSNNLKDDRDISRQCKSIYGRGNILISRFSKCSMEVKVTLFKTYCSQFYGSHLWSSYTRHALDRLRVAYNNVFRILMKVDKRSSISAILVNCNVNGAICVRRRSVTSFHDRIMNSDNLLVSTVVNSSHFYHSKILSNWCDTLFI